MKKVELISTSKLTRNFYLFLILMLSSLGSYAQNMGVNATGAPPNANAGLDVDFTDKGILIPRVALTGTANFAPLAAHVAGMIVYNTATAGDVTPGFYYNNGTRWVASIPAGNAMGDMLYWNGSTWVRIPAGIPGQFLQFSSSSIPAWTGAAFIDLTTTAVSAIAATTATSGGTIVNANGSTILTRGICYSTSPHPTTANFVVAGAATSPFSCNLTGLSSYTTYYVRAFATNNSVTSYGNEINFTTLATAPSMAATTAASSITGNSATTGGNVLSNGGSPIIERGVCYGTTSNPTIISNAKVVDGAPGVGSYTSFLTGLTGGTLYYVRAYATNSFGTTYGTQISFTTVVTPPTLYTVAASSISGTSAVSGGSMNWNGAGYSNYQEYGVAYSTTPVPVPPAWITTAPSYLRFYSNTSNFPVNPNVNIAPWVTNLTGLTSNTTYYIRSFLNVFKSSSPSGWVTVYGPELSFTTAGATAPVVASTTAITNISPSSATSGGNVTSNGGAALTARGVCWSTSPTPTLGANNFTNDGTSTGSFSSNITGLASNTLYYVRAYATNSIGTSYGPTDISFTTCVTPAYNLGDFVGGGVVFYVDCNGGGLIAALSDQSTSVVWGCSGTTFNTPATLGSGSANTTAIVNGCATRPIAASVASACTDGGFNDWYLPSSAELGLLVNSGWISPVQGAFYWSSTDGGSTTTASAYYYGNNWQASGGAKSSTMRVRAIRSFGAPTLPSVTTDVITNIAGTSATCGGNVTSDGGSAITAGVCWSTTTNPTIADPKTTDAIAIGPFVSNITGLTTGTLYYVRAYVTNVVGTAYGNEVSFTPTGNSIPTLTTDAISNITATGGTSGGNITSDGGDPVTVRGICWNDFGTPTTADFTTMDGSGTGPFTSTMTGLTTGWGYYVRAYATNGVGTAYGQEEFFIPTAPAAVSTLPLTYSSPASTATSGVWITSDGGHGVSALGIVWGTSPNPTTTSNLGMTSENVGLGWYQSSTMTGLDNTGATTYYVRAYFTDGLGTTYYGAEFSFTPGVLTVPVVVTDPVINLIGALAEGSATVYTDGGDPLTFAGLCWDLATNADPTVDVNLGFTTDGWMGHFFSMMTGLTVGTSYKFRAYATNGTGTAYGAALTFTATAAYVGQVIQGGNLYGTVFSVDGVGEHGLMAESWGGYVSSDWGCYATITGATGTAVGTGAANTSAIVADITTNGCISAKIVDGYDFVSIMASSWHSPGYYLPSKDEVDLLHTQAAAAGLFLNDPMWSSTEIDGAHAWYFDGAVWSSDLKSSLHNYWPIFSF